MYPTEDIAVDALIEARTHFEFKPDQGPVAIYLCDDCGHFHLTSQGATNPKLVTYIKDGKLKLMKEARNWENKIKKR